MEKSFITIEENKKYEKNLNGIAAWKIKLTELAVEAAAGKNDFKVTLEYPETFQDITEKIFPPKTHYIENGEKKIA